MRRITVTLYDPRVFWQKVTSVTLALFVLQPLLYFRLRVPAALYLGSILAIHAVFLYVYVAHVPWRRLWSEKRALLARVIGIIIVGYMLSLLKTTNSPRIVFVNIIAAATLHAVILALLMLKTVQIASISSK